MIIEPQATVYEVLLTTTTPVSHHDPAVQDEGNRTLFNRQKQILTSGEDAPVADWGAREAFAIAHRVPLPLLPIMEMLTFSEFVGVVTAKLFLDMYNSADGTGLFEGMERYARLETRLHMAAIPALTLREAWDRLCRDLQVPIHPGRYDEALLGLLSLPIGTQQNVLRALADDYRTVVAVAREWHRVEKEASEEYAQKAGIELDLMAAPELARAVEFREEPDRPRVRIIEAPAVSANSLRHQMVRAPSRLHLYQRLGFEPSWPGRGPFPEGLDAMFDNGGNIAAGAKAPQNAHRLAWQIREAFPSLDLLGGVTDAFDLGESALGVASWLVCRENLDGLGDSPAAQLPMVTASLFDLLDDVTLTRQSYSKATGQMILSFETLAKGAQILARFILKPHATALTHGALVAAIEYWRANYGVVGGQGARGFGYVTGEWIRRPDDALERLAEYEAYLDARHEELRAALVDGTLGAQAEVCKRT